MTLDVDTARRLADAGERIVLRWPALTLDAAPRLQGISFEAIVQGASVAELDDSLRALGIALARGCAVRAALAFGDTGIDCYRAAAATRRQLGTALPIRARWDGPLDVKGAALALTFGADEIAGPMAPPKQRYKLAQLGGPPEDGGRPSPDVRRIADPGRRTLPREETADDVFSTRFAPRSTAASGCRSTTACA